MWVIRVLSGGQAGQIFPLEEGTNHIGRAPTCNVKILSNGVSKEHAKIDAFADKVIIHDMGSRNGTFINGVQIKSQRLQGGDKIMLHDVVIEIAHVPDQYMAQMQRFNRTQPTMSQVTGNLAHNSQVYQQSQAYHDPNAAPNGEPQAAANTAPQGIKAWQTKAETYLEEVLLPGVYRLPQLMDFRSVLGVFLLVFIVFVTMLSSIPLVTILKSSIEKESQARALTIARTIAKLNRSAIMSGLESTVTVEIAQREAGVDKAYIIKNIDGSIIAPTSMAGKYPKESFIHSARLTGKEVVDNISGDIVGALVPISYYNPNTGAQSIAAHAVVIYNMGSIAINDERTLSLLIQTLFIALLIGAIIFYFMYKMIEHPIVSLNKQLDEALKMGAGEVSTTYKFPAFEKLISNVGSAITRMGSGDDDGNQNFEYDRNQELNNVIQLIGYAAIAITAHDNNIAAVNPTFEEITGLSSGDLLFHSFESMTDQALRLSVKDLIERVDETPDQMQTNELEISGSAHEVIAQAVYGTDKIAYYLIVVLPGEAEE